VVRTVAALVAVVGLVALYHLGLYVYVDRSMGHVSALATDGPEILAPQLQAGTENYLVVGSHVPGQTGPASVTALLASVSAGGDRAVVVSLPPTALVDTPVCRASTGKLREPRTEAFAAALLDGGPSCLVRSVQQLSGLRVDHYLDVDLARLPGLVDALGGVSVCVTPSPAVQGARSPLPAGTSSVSGPRAAAYLRPAGTGADATGSGVAVRAQSLLTATLRTAMSAGTLTDTVTLTRFLSRAADALTVDDATTLGDLRGLGSALGRLSGGGAQRADLPVAETGYVPAGSKQSYVLLDGPATRALFDGVIDRTRVPAGSVAAQSQVQAQAGDGGDAAAAPSAASAAPSSAGPGDGAAQPLTVAPSGVTVDVLNGTGTGGLAATAADALRGQGFGVGTVGNATGSVTQTVVRYAPDAQERARTVAAAVPGAVLQADPTAGGNVQLVLGPGYTRVVAVPAPVAAGVAPATSAPATRAAAPVRC
jgi:LCP family protein required for cell wall assembly